MLRALLVDDEAPARATLRHLLDGAEVTIVGEAEDGETALRAAAELAPDLVFLDVQMPEMTGLEVLERLPGTPSVVFTTAFDSYAVAAFELGAVDYLRKPFGRERLAAALARVRAVRDRTPAADTAGRVRWAIGATAGGAPPLSRLFIRDRGQIVPLRVDEIERLEGEDDYVGLHARGRRHLVYLTLNEFERRLDPDHFLRVHRSHIVNLDHVAALVPYDGTRLQVQMRDGTTLIASRTCSRRLRQIVI